MALDTHARRARVRLTLRGETEPVEIIIRDYALEHVDGQAVVTLVDVTASRPWLRESLQRFAGGRRLPLSPAADRALRFLT